jgi:predicted transporter
MEWKSLILGIVFCVGIFAVKSGVGLSYYMSKTTSTRARMGVWAGFAVTYLLVFAASGFTLEKIDLMRHLEAIQKWIQSGMLVHLLMAGMLVLWGLRLLRENGDAAGKSPGWLLLAAPCPVCATVIFFSLGFLTAYFPESPRTIAALLYLTFLLINLLTVWVMAAGNAARITPPETLLGGAMLIIAAYFFLSVTVMPNFTDIDKVYRMACCPSDQTPVDVRYLLISGVSSAAAFITGFGAVFYRIRRTA